MTNEQPTPAVYQHDGEAMTNEIKVTQTRYATAFQWHGEQHPKITRWVDGDAGDREFIERTSGPGVACPTQELGYIMSQGAFHIIQPGDWIITLNDGTVLTEPNVNFKANQWIDETA